MQSELDGEKDIVAAFARRERIVCTEGASRCGRYQRVHEATQGRPALRTTCEVHKVYGFFGSVLSPLAAHTARLHDVAQVLGSSDSMRTFRSALRELLAASLDFRPGSRPADSVVRSNIATLDVFLPPTSRTARICRPRQW